MKEGVYIETLIPRLGGKIGRGGIGAISKNLYDDYIQDKADLYEEFFLVTNTHVARVETKRGDVRVRRYRRINFGFGKSLYDLAAFIATGDKPQRIIPANSEVEKRLIDRFGAVGVERHLNRNSITFKVAHLPVETDPSDVVVLDYKPPQKQ